MLISEKTELSKEITELGKLYGTDRSALLPILQAIQRKHHYIPDFAQQEIADMLNIHPVEVYSVISFYSFLSSEPQGKYVVRLCKTIICDMNGKENIQNAIEREMNVKFGETTKDKKFTFQFTNCLGMCDQGPAMMINEKIYTNLTPEKTINILKSIK